jgi:tetratricopeptide (TPR) repeat protein
MIPFTPINGEEITETTAGKSQRDTQIEQCLVAYNEALRMQQQGLLKESMLIYENLIKNRLLREKLDSVCSFLQNSPIHTLQFVVFKNYAALCESSNDLEVAVTYYLKAYQIDSSDLVTLNTVAGIARKLIQGYTKD